MLKDGKKYVYLNMYTQFWLALECGVEQHFSLTMWLRLEMEQVLPAKRLRPIAHSGEAAPQIS